MSWIAATSNGRQATAWMLERMLKTAEPICETSANLMNSCSPFSTRVTAPWRAPFCTTFICSTVKTEKTVSVTQTTLETDRFTATATATITETSVVGAVETDTSTSTLLETNTVDVFTTIISTTDVPLTVATDVVTVTVATDTDITTVTTIPVTVTDTIATVTIVGRDDEAPACEPKPDQWPRNFERSELSSACSCIETTAPPARTIYTGTQTQTRTASVVTDITATVTATDTVELTRTSVTTVETEVVVTQITSQTTLVTVLITTTEDILATETTTLDVTATTTIDETATTTVDITATATATEFCECYAPFKLQVSGSTANGQYLYTLDSAILNDQVLGFTSASSAGTFTLNNQCQLVTSGFYSAVGQANFYDVIREVTSGQVPLVCSISATASTLSCVADAGQDAFDTEFSYNGLGYLAFGTPGNGNGGVITLNVVSA